MFCFKDAAVALVIKRSSKFNVVTSYALRFHPLQCHRSVMLRIFVTVAVRAVALLFMLTIDLRRFLFRTLIRRLVYFTFVIELMMSTTLQFILSPKF